MPAVDAGGHGGRRRDSIASRMNPHIPSDYRETGAWLSAFVRSHAKRECPRLELILETGGARQGRSYGVRVSLEGRVHPPPGSPPIELAFEDVAGGRTRFAWCEALAQRIRVTARELLDSASPAG
jgi:hypothetical protein